MVAPSQGILGAGSHPASHKPGSETVRADPRAAISHIHSLFLEMRATKRPSSDQYKEATVRMGYILCASRFWILKEKPNAVQNQETSGRNPLSLISSARHQKSPRTSLVSVDFGCFPQPHNCLLWHGALVLPGCSPPPRWWPRSAALRDPR